MSEHNQNDQHPWPIGEAPSADLDAEQARELLAQAQRLDSATRSGASLVPSAFLLALGALCSMFVVTMHLVMLTDERLVWLALTAFLPWLAILLAAMTTSIRYVKVGFGRRWAQTMGAWGILWAVTMFGTTRLWKGEVWFVIVSIAALTALTTWGAWREVRR
ncbi:hypothetical protein ACSL103130_12700 [Actinomyces slackii]|uniref:Uncharacterized protein n=1 Tax=Actinomyces slackii TaxID=52774 RepID=A0A3S4WLS4_9ACTO|nr:hypothetical protein [Actinomyces slackii]VEG75719.1 Uncharacterised protein [Actinomyces slackii]